MRENMIRSWKENSLSLFIQYFLSCCQINCEYVKFRLQKFSFTLNVVLIDINKKNIFNKCRIMDAVYLDNSDLYTNLNLTLNIKYPKSTNWNVPNNRTTLNKHWLTTDFMLLIPMYIVIFVTSVIGNSLVIYILFYMKRMRTDTNLFLLNLAISDLFLGVFCMPFTLAGTILRDFVFGDVMCKLLPYMQGLYFSICIFLQFCINCWIYQIIISIMY
jgi:hypothetical protein